jgi:hypothetical protein
MHRSGTSVVSRMLALLGAHLGPESDLMPPKPDNPTGFWESRTVTNIHDDLLSALGGRWDEPSFVDDGFENGPELETFRERIRQAVASHYADADVAAWKDPRGSFSLRLWREVTDLAGTILVVREPGEVCASLSRRDGMEPETAAWLWLRYTIAAYRADSASLVVLHDDLYTRPQMIAARLQTFCGLPPISPETAAAIESFIEPRLRHREVAGSDGPTASTARAFYRLLAGGHRDIARPIADLLHNQFKTAAELERFRDRAEYLLSQIAPDRGQPRS